MTGYTAALREAMGKIAEHKRSVFVGQSVRYPGQAAFKTFELVPFGKLIEMPVTEDLQMGISAGLALEGYTVLSFYPRWDFLLHATAQLVNHLDKLPLMGWEPRVIVRVAVGRTKPLDAGVQHKGDYSEQFADMLRTITIRKLRDPKHIVAEYETALGMKGSSIMVEYMELYD